MGGMISRPSYKERVDSHAEHLNSFNLAEALTESDVVVIGAGIHSLIYAIHTRSIELRDSKTLTTMTLLEKSSSPGYKIGESTLTVFGLWLEVIGIHSPMLSRLFGPKDGLAFYYFSSTGEPEDYTQFVANGPPGDFVPTLQMERKISELMLTLFAQRLGITVLHGREAVIEGLEAERSNEDVTFQVKDVVSNEKAPIKARLVVDASGFNTHAFWAYFDCISDESEIPLRHYESVNTNHLCIAEGWAWVIRLPSWEGSPLPNLINMINYLLDLNAAQTPADEFPSAAELVEKFKLKFRWVISIGFALRSDVVYPEDLSKYGQGEAEQKFNWVVAKYQKITDLMKRHQLIHNLYGPGTTWFIRKNLAFRSPQVTGRNWIAIGDATGFTNPLYSPGINANMATSIFAAETTKEYFSSTDLSVKRRLLDGYENFCSPRIPNLQRMNVFNYVLMRSPALGPLGPLWQYLIGTGNFNFQNSRRYDLSNCAEFLTTWDWGSNQKEFITAATQVCKLLEGLPDAPLSPKTIDAVRQVSARSLQEAVATGDFKGRWGGLLRFYHDDLSFDADKVERDVLAKRCLGPKCGEWKMLSSDVRKCAFCGWEHTVEESTKIIYEE